MVSGLPFPPFLYILKGFNHAKATGDLQAEAQRVSSQLDISVLASSALPEKKLQLVKKLQKQGKKVAMVSSRPTHIGYNDFLIKYIYRSGTESTMRLALQQQMSGS